MKRVCGAPYFHPALVADFAFLSSKMNPYGHFYYDSPYTPHAFPVVGLDGGLSMDWHTSLFF